MFTFIRLLIVPQRDIRRGFERGPDGGNTKEIVPDPSDREQMRRPWRHELERLAYRRGVESAAPQAARITVPVPPPPHPLPKAPWIKQGTLTDLKIWWGKSTVYKTPDPKDLAKFAPQPQRKPNRWQQF